MATIGKFIAVIGVIWASCHSAEIVAAPLAECKGENCTSSASSAKDNVDDSLSSDGEQLLQTRSGNLNQESELRQMEHNFRQLEQSISVAIRKDQGNEFLTVLQTRTRQITRKVEDRSIVRAVEELKQIDREEADKLENAGSRAKRDYGQSLETLGSLVSTFATQGMKLMTGLNSGDDQEVFSATVGIASGLLSVIPHPAAEVGVMLLDLVSSFISIGTPKKPQTDPYKVIRDKIAEMVEEMKEEFDNYMFAKSAGVTDVLMHMFRMQIKMKSRYTRKSWNQLVEGNNMIAGPDLAIQDLEVLSTRIAYLVEENMSADRTAALKADRSKIIYRLYHAYVGLAGIRDMVLVKLTTLMPNDDENDKLLIKDYQNQINFNRMDAFEVLKVLHVPDDISIASVNFYYPIGMDSTSTAISNYLSTLTYTTDDGEGDLMPMADDAHMPKGNYYLQISHTKVQFFKKIDEDVYGGVNTICSRDYNDYGVPFIDCDWLIMGKAIHNYNHLSDDPQKPLPEVFNINYIESPTDSSHIITCRGATVRFVTSNSVRQNNKRRLGDIKVFAGQPDWRQDGGVKFTEHHKIIRIGDEDGTPIVVIGSRDGTRWWTKRNNWLVTGPLLTDDKGKVHKDQKFRLVPAFGYQNILGDRKSTLQDVCPGMQGKCKLVGDGSTCYTSNRKSDCLKDCIQNSARACWWINRWYDDRSHCCRSNGSPRSVKNEATQDPVDICWDMSRCKVIPGTEILSGPEVGSPSEGDWTEWKYCDRNRGPGRITGFRTRSYDYVEKSDDNTGLSGIKIECDGGYDEKEVATYVYGKWKNWQRCSSGYIIGFSVRSYATSNDKIGLVDMRAECSDDAGIGHGVLYGGWSYGGDRFTKFKRCSPPTYLCGLRARLQPYQGHGDDTAVNRIQLACCLNSRIVDLN